MNDRSCIRCQHPVLLEDGHLTYCSYCGAPQIFLSEELQEEIAQQAREYNERASPRAPAEPGGEAPSGPRRLAFLRPGETTQQPWSRAVQYALVSAGIALALGLCTLLFAPLGMLALIWAVSAPILTVTLFNARAGGHVPASSGFAAKLGLLTGILVAFSCAVVSALSLVLARFAFHAAGPLDAQLAAAFAQQRIVLLQRMGASAQPTLDMLAVPEFRVGILLSMTAISAAVYLLLSTLAAGLAGAVLGRRRTA